MGQWVWNMLQLACDVPCLLIHIHMHMINIIIYVILQSGERLNLKLYCLLGYKFFFRFVLRLREFPSVGLEFNSLSEFPPII